MKKLFLSALVVISALAGQVRASESDVFKVNDAQVNEEFAQLNKIEDFVLSHEGVSYDEMKSQNPELVAGLNESPDSFTPRWRITPWYSSFRLGLRTRLGGYPDCIFCCRRQRDD
jgi:hypothetical protein